MTPEELRALLEEVKAAAEGARITLLYAALGLGAFFLLNAYAKRN